MPMSLDLLFTFEWPLGMCSRSKLIAPAYADFGSSIVQDFLSTRTVRYVFSCGENRYFEREPYLHNGQFVRFISLGNVGGKERWWHCFDYNREEHSSPGPRKQQSISRPKSLMRCWFCLGNPEFRKHLVVHVGQHFYMALAKGGLIENHLVIVPIEHLPSTEPLSAELIDELCVLRRSLDALFKDDGLIGVYFCLCHIQSHHWHMQCVAIPQDRQILLKDVAASISDTMDLTLSDTRPNTPLYFSLETGSISLYSSIKSSTDYFPAQIGRQIMAKMLDVPNTDWRENNISDEEENVRAKRLKSRLVEYL